MNHEVSLIYLQYVLFTVRLDACKTCQIVEANFLGSLANKGVCVFHFTLNTQGLLSHILIGTNLDIRDSL